MRKIIKKKRIIFITGDRKKEAAHFMYYLLKDYFSCLYIDKYPGIKDVFLSLGSDIVIIEDNTYENPEKIRDFLSDAKMCIFVITETEKKNRIKILLKRFPKKRSLIIDFSLAKKIRRNPDYITTFGINRKKADIYVTDINQKETGTNFKFNYELNIIPFWTKEKLKNKEIYSMLPALCLAKMLGFNLADISYKFKERE